MKFGQPLLRPAYPERKVAVATANRFEAVRTYRPEELAR